MGHTHGGGEHTHGGGGFDPMPILIVIAAIAVAGPVMAAVAELIHILLIAVAVIAGLAAAGVVALAAFHVHRWRAGGTVQRPLPALPRRPPVQAPREPPSAIEQHVHHHWHDLSAAEVAAIIRAQQEDQSQPGG